MNDALLALQEVSHSFGGLVAVRDVSFEVARGMICGLIGPNGAGKSTLFNLIAGELAPSRGSIRFVGEEVAGLPSFEIARRGVARAFQLVHLFESRTVTENALVGAERHDRLEVGSALLRLGSFKARERAALRRAHEALDLVGIGTLGDRPVTDLSHGQQRLVATARALAAEPLLLLLDEPASGLSGPEMEWLRQAIQRARERGTAVLLVEHNVEFVMGLCDHIVVLHQGEAIASGSPADVRRSEAVLEAYLGR
jgi:ABC-type branched-subunit amino acid transport system ATPase component